ncbi:cytochrome P450 [Plectosphaerella plurivora]|uniref:Cytochrome P450 n=1 Tax=Plectosphaerella plurivora TaxID=936078 RepID=A0A9P8V5Q5_9PEZI|nr:cytochrome P450 [Plectosphaerella plurivora]
MATILTDKLSISASAALPLTLGLLVIGAVINNVVKQLWFPDPNRPPVVFHIFPFIGSTVEYGIDPYKFFAKQRARHGDCFTFIMLGKPTTVYLGAKGNNFILNGKHADLNAEQVYGKLTTPVFGKGVIYDCPNERLMDQKRLIKEGFTTEALRSYIPSFVKEVEDYINTSPRFKGQSGECNITDVLSEVTIYTAAGSLQGREVRSKFDTTFAALYRHLDDGFQPINFVMPWLPLPQNRRRDRAQQVMERLYGDIIQRRRVEGNSSGETDMLWALMDAHYKDGTAVPDEHISRLMIALLMGGQHNTAASGAWIMLHLAHQPELVAALYAEQVRVLDGEPLTLENMQRLDLNARVIKETLRLHSPIHSILRQVTTPMPVPGTAWVIPPTHTLLASPSFLARTEETFERPLEFDPERWTVPQPGEGEQQQAPAGAELISKAVSSPYLPFGAGRHRCLGEHYAYAQLGAIVATMVRMLEIEQVDPNAPVPPTDYSSMFSRPMTPAIIRWRRRA